jgi:hypothetical protein
MSNPLLRPNDPRFHKPDIRDQQGKNLFGDGQAEQKPPSGGEDIYSAATTDEARPFVPQYQVQQHSRPTLLFILAGVGWAAAVVGAISLAGFFDFGWISPLLGVVPAGAAWLLAYEELKAIAAGVIASEAREKSRHAYWLGLMGLILCLAMIAAMIYRGLNFLPQV